MFVHFYEVLSAPLIPEILCTCVHSVIWHPYLVCMNCQYDIQTTHFHVAYILYSYTNYDTINVKDTK